MLVREVFLRFILHTWEPHIVKKKKTVLLDAEFLLETFAPSEFEPAIFDSRAVKIGTQLLNCLLTGGTGSQNCR